MTNSEFKKKIVEANDVEWFNTIEETLSFPHSDVSLPLKGVSSIYEFVNQQISGWEQLGGSIPQELSFSKRYFLDLKNSLINFINTNLTQSRGSLSHSWRNVNEQIKNRNTTRVLTFDSPQVDFLLKIHETKPSCFKGAFNYLMETNDYNIGNRENFFGAVLAYEFLFKDQTQMPKRRSGEDRSISAIKNDFKKYLSESETHLADHLNKANEAYKAYAKSIDSLKDEKNELFNTWFKNVKEDHWEKFYEPSKGHIGELTTAYREKLKLEEPAKFWSDRGEKLKRQGWIALGVLILLVGATCWSLGKILWTAPEQLYASWFADDKSAAIRWSIIYITLISFIAYCVRAITKVMFSSFHLSRDCEERHTLTYFYLALLKDSKVDDKDRQLIIQSLFSRAETGLLKDDSSPTMPSDAITKMTSR